MATELTVELERYVQLTPVQFQHVIDHIFFKDLEPKNLQEYEKPYTREALVEHLLKPLMRSANVTTNQSHSTKPWSIFDIKCCISRIFRQSRYRM